MQNFLNGKIQDSELVWYAEKIIINLTGYFELDTGDNVCYKLP